MLRPSRALLLAAAASVIGLVAGTARAEKANMSREDLAKLATHVVRGTVSAISSRTVREGPYAVMRYVAEVRVLAVEKGEGIGTEAPLYARYWTQGWKGPGTMPPGTSGHRGLPTEGQTLRIYLARNAYDGFATENHDGGFNVIGANGFEPLAPGEAAATAPPVPSTEPGFPASWRGTWKGKLTQATPGGPARPATTMEIALEPTDSEGRWRFAIHYGGQPVREYVLGVRDAQVGSYEIDEGNSIVLPATYIDGELFSWFSMNGDLFLARYRLVGDTLLFEMTQTSLTPSSRTGGKDRVPEVGGHAVHVVQRAALRR
jgi:hypothetical protein